MLFGVWTRVKVEGDGNGKGMEREGEGRGGKRGAKGTALPHLYLTSE